MADQKPALVVHLAAGGEPLLFALSAEESERVGKDLSHFVRTGSVQTVQTTDDSTVAINFSHVAAAYIDDLNRKNKVFGLH